MPTHSTERPMGRRGTAFTSRATMSTTSWWGLEFSSAEAAMTFVEALRPVWGVSGAGQAWVLQEAEAATY